MMKILLAHNYYQQPGGEDEVFATEGRLLEEKGHQVVRFTRHNDSIAVMGRFELARWTLWNGHVKDQLLHLFRKERPQIAHFHNTFPLISPAAYHAARQAGIPVVQTLHNYRLLCANGLLFRDGGPCEDCVGKLVPWPGVLHSCYRRDPLASAVVVAMQTVHRALGTWQEAVDLFIALTEFARREYIKGGLPAERIAVKPNCLYPDPGRGGGDGGFALYVGRLSPEKGIRTLLEAWRQRRAGPPLKIVGDGPLASEVSGASRELPFVEWLGRRTAQDVLELMGKAAFLVVPSEWFEGFPRVIAEAFARGTPVVASDLGALAEIVDDGRTGLIFHAGNAGELAEQVDRMVHSAPTMRSETRREFELKYSAASNYALLLRLYRSVTEGRG